MDNIVRFKILDKASTVSSDANHSYSATATMIEERLQNGNLSQVGYGSYIGLAGYNLTFSIDKKCIWYGAGGTYRDGAGDPKNGKFDLYKVVGEEEVLYAKGVSADMPYMKYGIVLDSIDPGVYKIYATASYVEFNQWKFERLLEKKFLLKSQYGVTTFDTNLNSIFLGAPSSREELLEMTKQGFSSIEKETLIAIKEQVGKCAILKFELEEE